MRRVGVVGDGQVAAAVVGQEARGCVRRGGLAARAVTVSSAADGFTVTVTVLVEVCPEESFAV